MDFPTLISKERPYPIVGVLGCIFHLLNFNRTYENSEYLDQTPHYAVSDLVLHCLPMSIKKDTRLIWVNVCKQVLPPVRNSLEKKKKKKVKKKDAESRKPKRISSYDYRSWDRFDVVSRLL